MKKFILALGILGLFSVQAQAGVVLSTTEQRVPGQLIIKFKDSKQKFAAQRSMLSTLQRVLGEKSVRDLIPFKTEQSLFTLHLGSDKLVGSAMALLKKNSGIAAVEPNVYYHAFNDGIPNDPQFSKLWGMSNNGQVDSASQSGVPGIDIDVTKIWQSGIVGSRKVLVAVIDTGIDLTHPDLVANIYTNPGEAGTLATNGIDDDGNGFIDDFSGWDFVKNSNDSSDGQGHGTHVSGTIGASGNNGIGVAGVNWEVSLLSVKFLDSDGSGTLEGAIEAVNYAAMMKARVINASWGGPSSSPLLEEAIRKTGDAGCLFVAAAGNDGSNNDVSPSYPAGYKMPHLMSVAAMDNQGKLARFSNYGKGSVHIAAPGVNIYSTAKGGGYVSLSGTSMAAPHVVGVAALLYSAFPDWDFNQIKQRIVASRVPVRAFSKKMISGGWVSVNNSYHDIIPPSEDPVETDWKDYAFEVESEHPYQAKANQTFEIHVPGVKAIRVHYETVDTEANFDFVSIETPAGEMIEKVSGKLQNYTSDYVSGDRAIIRMKSDMSVQAWGFKIDKIQIIE